MILKIFRGERERNLTKLESLFTLITLANRNARGPASLLLFRALRLPDTSRFLLLFLFYRSV